MAEISIPDTTLRQAAAAGMDDFIGVFTAAISEAAGGTLNAQALQTLTPEQLTLWGYSILRSEVMDGGFIQLIYNGYGPFFFDNPFAKALRLWGLKDLSKLIYKARELYTLHKEDLTRERTDEAFMALFEQYPQFDDLDDEFVENEEDYTERIARYVDENLPLFATIS